MRTRNEIPSDGIFRRFREYAGAELTSVVGAETLLTHMCNDAATFRGFAQLHPESAMGGFFVRVIEALEAAATTPILLWLLSENHKVPEEQIAKGLGAIESWVVRRTVLRLTMKNVNQLVVSLLGTLDLAEVESAGDGDRGIPTGPEAD